MFKICSNFAPTGDQPQAIDAIVRNLTEYQNKHQVLLGVTGSGKTFTVANVIQQLNKPTLVIAPNKTLAAQLFLEFKDFFPNNAVDFFISYYDYYQPEAYIPSTDTYIEKDAVINDDIDKMRHSATRSLFERKDVIIVASVSCIYGLGSPHSYSQNVISIEKGLKMSRNAFLKALINIQYSRNDALLRGTFRVRGSIVDVLASHQKDEFIRIGFDDNVIEFIQVIDMLTGRVIQTIPKVSFYPNTHYIPDNREIPTIIKEILEELGDRLRYFKQLSKHIESQRLETRVMNDIEMIEQLGWCKGIENYSRYFTGLPPGHPPPTLLDYFPSDFLVVIDESHISIPQLKGMYRGDRARKETLVEYGFRLPSALDNRPLNFEEFTQRVHQVLYVSATPGEYEIQKSCGNIIEQIIRPTGLVDPEIIVKPATNQVDDLYNEIVTTVNNSGRVLIVTLTKRMAEDLAKYYEKFNIKVKYLHSDIDSIERVDILRGLRRGDFDVLIGINLLREGLDLPEVKLVAIMDADKEGFLRSKNSLIQIAGRAARNVDSRVLFYANTITESMKACMEETQRRRTKQIEYNKKHGIIPRTIVKNIKSGLKEIYGLYDVVEKQTDKTIDIMSIIKKEKIKTMDDFNKLLKRKSKEMHKAAQKLDFEHAALVRDQIIAIKEFMLSFASDTNIVGANHDMLH